MAGLEQTIVQAWKIGTDKVYPGGSLYDITCPQPDLKCNAGLPVMYGKLGSCLTNLDGK